MADADPEVMIKISADTEGGEKAAKSLDKVKKSSGGMMDAMSRMKESVERARGALMAMGGIGAIIGGAVQAFKAWRQAASETAAEIQKVNVGFVTKQIAEMAEAEQRANAEIARGNQLRAAAAASDEKRLQTARRLEDAARREAKARELAAVGDGPDAEFKRREIELRYSSQQGETALDRERDDVQRKVRQLREEAARANETAAGKEAYAAEQGELAKGERKTANKAAVAASRKMQGNGWWASLTGATDEANNLSEKSAAHQAAAEAAQKEADKARDDALANRDLASAKLREADEYEASLKAIDADKRATRAEGALASGENTGKWNKAKAERAKEAEDLATAKTDKGNVEVQIAAAKKSLEDIQSQRYTVGVKAAQAGDAYDAAVARGASKRDQRTAYDARQAAMLEAENANHSLDVTEEKIKTVLESLNARLRKLASTVEQGEKRQAAKE